MHTIAYALCAGAGLSTVLDPPGSIQGLFGSAITLTWGWIATVGGILGVAACPAGKWMVEKPAIILCGTATFIYAGIILTLHIQEQGNRLPQFFFVAMALFFLASRYGRIHPFSYQPGK